MQEIISRWAPSSENDTISYASDVARLMGMQRDGKVDLTNPDTMLAMVKAIIYHENGPHHLQ